MVWMLASSPAIRRGVKVLLTRWRNWVCRGGSLMMSMGRNSSVMSTPGGVGKLPDAEEVAGSLRAAVASP
jgi:hypothetical protein